MQPLGTPGPAQASAPETAADAAIVAQRGLVLVVATTSDCAPCALLKPIVRKLAVDLAGRVSVIEIDGGADPAFCRRQRIDRFPDLLLFRDGELRRRRVGYHGAVATRDWLAEAIDTAARAEESDQPAGCDINWPAVPTSIRSAAIADVLDTEFDAAIERADAAMQAIMRDARERLDASMTRIAPALEALERRLGEALATGALTAAEAALQRRAGHARLYAPFQDQIDALRAAQDAGLRCYDEIAGDAVSAYAAARRAGDSRFCDAESGACDWTPRNGGQPRAMPRRRGLG